MFLNQSLRTCLGTELLLSLAKALTKVMAEAGLETKINMRIKSLVNALGKLMFPRNDLPEWDRSEFTDKELFWFANAVSAFNDEGI
jgi:sulfite reductase beta subunit-like hemoprotein